ncbi:MAG: hypothetical protein K2X43_02890 [Hyphomonadaceae bacterium]|jgi:hypothetical protein|nr:hypothetical protein [Hyphomonadaceae bacterium]
MIAVMPALRHKIVQWLVMATGVVLTVVAMAPVDLVPAMRIDTVTSGVLELDNPMAAAMILPTFGSGGRTGQGRRWDCDQGGSQ